MAPSQTELKEIFNLYDDEMSGDIDGTQVGDVARACGLRVTNALVWKAAGKEYAKKGEKRVKFEEWLPIYEQLKKEEVAGTISDFMEGLKVFDQEGEGFITVGEFRHVLMAMGERLSKEEVDELMLLATVDGNGLMKYEPFIKLIVAGPGDGGDDK